jgi:hypothetical protein
MSDTTNAQTKHPEWHDQWSHFEDSERFLFDEGLWPIGAGLMVVLVEYAGHRYSYPTEFIYFLLIALAPLLWRGGRDDASAASTA